MKALIIDDEPPVIAVVKMLVDWKQFQIDSVVTAASSEQALEVLEKEQPEIILSDLHLRLPRYCLFHRISVRLSYQHRRR